MIRYQETQRLFLTGMKHCGKSTLGQLLSAQHGWMFVDLDDVIRSLWIEDGNPPVSSVRTIYQSHGATRFRDLEARAAGRISALQANETRVVAALGGGTLENDQARAQLEGRGVFVYLQEDPEALFKRVVRGGIPPFLDPQDPRASFMETYVRRVPRLEASADLVVSVAGLDVESALATLDAKLEEYIDGR